MLFRTKGYQDAEKAAEKVLHDYNIKDAPVPVEEIVQSLGLTLLVAAFKDSEIAGYIDLKAGQIVVNANDPPNRQAFTIAHEIGHYVLHKDQLLQDPNIGVVHRKPIGGETEPIEKEANCFAANLLVPDFLLQKKYKYQTAPLAAKIFGVSEEVIRYRLKDTNRI